jgi:hypothetical protein
MVAYLKYYLSEGPDIRIKSDIYIKKRFGLAYSKHSMSVRKQRVQVESGKSEQ